MNSILPLNLNNIQAVPMSQEDLLNLQTLFAAAIQDPQMAAAIAQIQMTGGKIISNQFIMEQQVLSDKANRILYSHQEVRNVVQIKKDLKQKVESSKYKILLKTDKDFLQGWNNNQLSLDEIDPSCDLNIMMVCVLMGYHKLGLQLLDKGASVNLSNKNGLTPLMYACILVDEDFVEVLLNKDADVLGLDVWGMSALMHGILSESSSIVKILLKKEANIHVTTPDGSDALQIAASKGHHGIVEILIEKARLDSQDLNGWTPLMKATLNNHFHVVELLCEKGANVDLENCQGNTAVHICADNNRPDCLKF